MLLANLVATVRQRLGDEAIPARAIETEAEVALGLLAEKEANGPHAVDFQREDSLTLVAGVTDLPVDGLPGYVSRAAHADLTPTELIMVSDRSEFSYQFCNEFALFAIEQGKIFTKPPQQGPDPLPGPLLVTLIVIPTLATLKAKYEDDFVTLLIAQMKGDRAVPKQARA